jgi:transcriptional regulator with XRE-family HTH domain
VAETVGTRIRAARKQKGWSQVELALRIGHTGRQRMSSIERGLRKATVEEIVRLAVALDVTSDHLLGLHVVGKESIVVERVQDSDRCYPGPCQLLRGCGQVPGPTR